MRAALSRHLPSRWYDAPRYLYGESGSPNREKKKKRERERKKLFTKKFLISPAVLQQQTEQKQTLAVSSSLSKSSVITLKLSLKIKSDYIINSIILYLCSSL